MQLLNPMIFITTLSDIELLPEWSGVSKMSGRELLDRLASVFDYLPEGTTFSINGEKISITIPEAQSSQKAEAARLAEKAALFPLHHGLEPTASGTAIGMAPTTSSPR